MSTNHLLINAAANGSSLEVNQITKIISGGQTGADQGALDAALHLHISHGGFCPKGRLSEDGPIPTQYDLTELNNRDYAKRTKANVLAADATLIFYSSKLGRGSRLTIKECEKANKPYLAVDITDSESDSVIQIQDFLSLAQPTVINVAGTRESKCPGMRQLVRGILISVFNQE